MLLPDVLDRESARSVSGERRVLGYGGIFHGCHPMLP
jgi:hypothetical protein